MKKTIFTTTLLFLNITFAGNPALKDYQPTNLKNFEQVNEAYDNLNKYSKPGSQCYNRAHYWAFELYQKLGIQSKKAIIYFTAKYKRHINGQWWFHTAPVVTMNKKDYVLDPEFLDRAVTLESWKNGCIDHAIWQLTPQKISKEKQLVEITEKLKDANLIPRSKDQLLAKKKEIEDYLKYYHLEKPLLKTNEENYPYKDLKEIADIDCPIIDNFSEIAQRQDNALCFIQFANMYYWEPGELELLEAGKQEPKMSWDNSEVFTAFKKAFKGRFPY
jgi:hypothetical protein